MNVNSIVDHSVQHRIRGAEDELRSWLEQFRKLPVCLQNDIIREHLTPEDFEAEEKESKQIAAIKEGKKPKNLTTKERLKLKALNKSGIL